MSTTNKKIRQEKALKRLISPDGYILPGKELEVNALARKGITIEYKKDTRTWLEQEVERLFKGKEYDDAYKLAILAQGKEMDNEYVQKAKYYCFTFGFPKSSQELPIDKK